MLIGFVRQVMIAIDTIVYGLLEILFTLILDLSTFDIFTEATIRRFSERIYLILGIVMVFRIMISLVQLLVDPSKSKDTDKGAIGIYKRTAICLVLIVSIRPIFMLLKQVQEPIIEAIPKVFLGRGTTSSATDTSSNNSTQNQANIHSSDSEIGKTMANSGRLMAWYSFLPFFMYSDGCTGGSGQGVANLYGVIQDAQVDGGENTISSVAEAGKHVKDKKCGNSEDEDGYDFKYQFLLSTLVGGYLVYVMVSIALAVAIRTIKLSICQIIAPIPIASYIDPKLSEKTFWNWVNTTIKTYVDLFTRLVVVYFILYVFLTLFGSGEDALGFSGMVGRFDGDYVRASLVMIFIIVGLLQFAKDMPKFISKLLGVDEGFGDIAGMFKGEGWKTMAGAAGMVTGTAKALATGTANSWRTSKFNDNWRSKGAKAGLAAFSGLNALRHGATAALRTGIKTGAAVGDAKDKKFKDAYTGQYHAGDGITNAQLSALSTKSQTRARNHAANEEIKKQNERLSNMEAEKSRRTGERADAYSEAVRNTRRARAQQRTANSDFTRANNRNQTAQTALSGAQNAVDSINGDIETENTNYNTEIAKLNEQRDVMYQYASARLGYEEATDAVNQWTQKLRTAKNAGERAEAQTRLTQALQNQEKYRTDIEKISDANRDKGYTFGRTAQEAFDIYNASESAITAENARHNSEITRLNGNLNAANTTLTTAKNEADAAKAAFEAAKTKLDTENAAVAAAESAEAQALADVEAVRGEIAQEIKDANDAIANAQSQKVNLSALNAKNTMSEFIGLRTATGQDLIDFAQHTKEAKASFFTGEAFNKIEENISDLAGGPNGTRDVYDFKPKDGPTIHTSFTEMINARSRLNSPGSNGKVTISTSSGDVTLSSAEFNEYFKAAQKVAGRDYIDRCLQQPGTDGYIKNLTIVEAKKREIQTIATSALPKAEKDKLIGLINKSFGQYLLEATDRAETMRTQGEIQRDNEKLLESSKKDGSS